MRRTLRWALTLLVALLSLAVATPAHAADPTLKASPASGPVGTRVTLDYAFNVSSSCSPGDQVWFRYDNQQSTFAQRPLSSTCTASTSFRIPQSFLCGSTHTFVATIYYVANGYEDTTTSRATATFKVTCAVVVPTVSLSPRPSRTTSPTPSPTPSPTASATPSATATPTASATPSPTFASASPQAVVPVEPPDIAGPSGASKTPWYVGGALVGVLGLAASWFLVKPRTGTPVMAGVVVGSVVVAGGMFLLAPEDPPVPVVLGSYAIGDGEGCAHGDIPVAGGFYSLDTPSGLLRFQPRGSSSDTGYWETSVGGTGHQSAVCLRLGTKAVWRVRSRTLAPTAPSGAVSCQTDEWLVSGGFAFPWGLSGLSSYPQAPMRWVAANAPYTDGPAPAGEVSALCAELPSGVRTYTTTASSTGGGTAAARCFPGDHPLGGGFSGRDVVGSYPTADGWSVQPQAQAASAYALCFHPSRLLGLKTSYAAQETDGDARCNDGDVLLGGGWESGTTLDGLQHFEPNGTGWKVEKPGGGPVTAYALCAKRY